MTLDQMKSMPQEEQRKLFDKLKAIRLKAKIVNFSALYGVGKEALSRNSNMKLRDASKLLKTFWERNHAIRRFAQSCKVKEIYGQKWVFNPMSRFWYSLRADKDIFSTVNQSSSAYIFDKWITNIRKQGIKIPFQYHDEIVFNVKKTDIDFVKGIIEKAIKELNNSLKLNVELGCSVEWGLKYSEIH